MPGPKQPSITHGVIVTMLLSFSVSLPENLPRVVADTGSVNKRTAQPVRIHSIPPRRAHAITGSQFARMTAAFSDFDRQKAALAELERGNIPDFMRTFYPLKISVNPPKSTMVSAIVWVSPDYISIGSDSDFLRFPLAYFSATTITRLFGCMLPTPKMVDTIYRAASERLQPHPLHAGSKMRSNEYCLLHQKIIEKQRRYRPVCGIIAGHKKDVVITNRLWKKNGRIAIYGWHGDNCSPIQPLSTIHGEQYSDYSHGIRLIRDSVLIHGRLLSMYDILQDDTLAPLLTYEGAIRDPRELMQRGSPRTQLSVNILPDRFAASEP